MNNRRNSNQHKKTSKGRKSIHGHGEYDETPKNVRASYGLAHTGRNDINSLVQHLDIAARELKSTSAILTVCQNPESNIWVSRLFRKTNPSKVFDAPITRGFVSTSQSFLCRSNLNHSNEKLS